MDFNKNQIILFGFFFHLLAAIFSVGYHHCDELFQVFEFAGYKLGINSAADLPWEFREQMRSGIQPLVVYWITIICHSVSLYNPFHIAMLIRVLESVLAFLAMVKLLNLLEEEIIQKNRRWLWWFGLLSWCLPYFHARFSSENLSSTLFIIGLVSILKTKQTVMVPLLAGVLFGLAFLVRFQVGFMIGGLFAWLIIIQKTNFKTISSCIAGILIALGFGLLADYWMYDCWTLSWWNYLDMNLFKDKASDFGRQPIYFYLGEVFLQLIPPFSIIIIVSLFYFWYKSNRHVLTWITIPFVAIHFIVAHKELRFLFPMVNFLPFIVICFFQNVTHHKNQVIIFLNKKWFLRSCIVINTMALLIFTFKPADNISYSLKKIYELTDGPNPIMIYRDNDPYNNMAALNYFRKPGLNTVNADSLQLSIGSDNIYFFTEKFGEGAIVIVSGREFVKIYSNFPDWFSTFNFNSWLDRSFTFSIYRLKT